MSNRSLPFSPKYFSRVWPRFASMILKLPQLITSRIVGFVCCSSTECYDIYFIGSAVLYCSCTESQTLFPLPLLPNSFITIRVTSNQTILFKITTFILFKEKYAICYLESSLLSWMAKPHRTFQTCLQGSRRVVLVHQPPFFKPSNYRWNCVVPSCNVQAQFIMLILGWEAENEREPLLKQGKRIVNWSASTPISFVAAFHGLTYFL